MTKSVEQARRELFESRIVLPDGVKWCPSLGKYIGKNFWLADYAWRAVNEMLDAVTIELPARTNSSLTRIGALLDAEHNATIEECRAAIAATGLGIKTK